MELAGTLLHELTHSRPGPKNGEHTAYNAEMRFYRKLMTRRKDLLWQRDLDALIEQAAKELAAHDDGS